MVEMPISHKVTKSMEQKWVSSDIVTFDTESKVSFFTDCWVCVGGSGGESIT